MSRAPGVSIIVVNCNNECSRAAALDRTIRFQTPHRRHAGRSMWSKPVRRRYSRAPNGANSSPQSRRRHA
jgi:hypothetical protein